MEPPRHTDRGGHQKPSTFSTDASRVPVPSDSTILCRSAHHGGHAVGAWILGWRISGDLTLCQCCSDVMEPGEVVVVVELHGERLHVCADCAGPA